MAVVIVALLFASALSNPAPVAARSNVAPSAPLTVGNTGYARVTDNHLHVDAPAIAGGVGTINWRWRYFPAPDSRAPVDIPGAAGTGAPKSLEWDVPTQYRNADGFVACRIADDKTVFEAVGYGAATATDIGWKSVHVPFFAPAPALPTNSALKAVFDASSAIPAGKVVSVILVGDSITNELQGRVQTLLDTLAPRKFLVTNAGNPAANFNDWQRTTAADSAPRTSVVAGYAGRNNFAGAAGVARTAAAKGNPVVYSVCLGTNSGGDKATLTALCDDLQSPNYGVPDALIVIDDLLYQRGFFGSNNAALALVAETILHPVTEASKTDKRYRGTTGRHAYFLNHLELFRDTLHPSPAGYDVDARFRAASILSALAARYRMPPPRLRPKL